MWKDTDQFSSMQEMYDYINHLEDDNEHLRDQVAELKDRVEELEYDNQIIWNNYQSYNKEV